MNKICDECETVAHCLKHGCIPKQQALDKKAENARELGLHYEPAQRKPLTDEEISAIGSKIFPSTWNIRHVEFARAIEAKLKEKNT